MDGLLKLKKLERFPDGQLKEVVHEQNIANILAFNEEQRKHSDENWKKEPDLKFLGRIPMSTVIKLQKLGIWDDEQALKKWLQINRSLKGTTKTI